MIWVLVSWVLSIIVGIVAIAVAAEFNGATLLALILFGLTVRLWFRARRRNGQS